MSNVADGLADRTLKTAPRIGVQPSRWRPKARRPCRAAAGQTTTSPGKIKLHRPDKWPVIRAEQTGYDLACRIVHASMGSGKTVS